MRKPYKIQIEDYMYNNNYTIYFNYKKGPKFYLVI